MSHVPKVLIYIIIYYWAVLFVVLFIMFYKLKYFNLCGTDWNVRVPFNKWNSYVCVTIIIKNV